MFAATPTGHVQSLYRIGGARWYGQFRVLWRPLTSRAAEAALNWLLRKRTTDGCRVLDIGCGAGHNLGRLQRLCVPFASYRGIDLADANLDVA